VPKESKAEYQYILLKNNKGAIFMKKFLSVLTAVLTLVSCVSCSTQGKNPSQAEPENFNAEPISRSYKRSKTELLQDFNAIYRMTPYNNGENYLICGNTSENPIAFLTADKNLQNFTKIKISDFPFGTSYDFDVSNDGTIIQIVSEADYGDLPEPDIYAEDYDAELYEENAEYKIFINRFSATGEMISSNEITDIYNMVNPENAFISGVYSFNNTEKCMAYINNKYYIINSDGSLDGVFNKEFESIGKNSEGDIVCAIKPQDGKLKICRVNPDTAKIEESSVTYDFTDFIKGGIIPASGEYSLYIPCAKSIYGIRKDNSSIESLFDVVSSGVNPNDMKNFFFDNDGNINIFENDYSKFKVTARKYTECDPEELAKIPVLTLGTDVGDTLNAFIADFNDSQSDMRIEIKDYSQYNTQENWYSGIEKMSLDCISGSAPDIFVISDNSYKLEKMGAFADLYDYINKSTLIPSIARNFETDGHLYSLPNVFRINTSAVKTKNTDKKDFWTAEDYINALENLPEGESLGYISYPYYPDSVATKYDIYNELLHINEYISEDGLSCSFDSDTYIKMLEVCDRYPLEEYIIDDSGFSDEENEQFQYNETMAFKNDKMLIEDLYLTGYTSYYCTKKGKMGDEDFTLIEVPECTSSDRFAISAQSDKKDLAWQFISQFFSDELYKDDELKNSTTSWGFPVTKSGLEIMAEKDKQPVEYPDRDYNGLYFYAGDESIEIGLPDDDTIKEVNEIIDNIQPSLRYSDYIETILYEEVQKFFNGDCTAKECAEVTQSRISIYLAEKQ